MLITQDVLEQHRQLSEVSAQFLAYAKENPEVLKASAFNRLMLNDDLFTLQPWPTFINKTVKEQFSKVASSLFRLCKSIPARIFGNDPQKISEYYEIPLDEAKTCLQGITDDHLEHLVGRGDFTLSSSGLKCLEFNVTTNLGGWDVPVWESLYLSTPVISKFISQNQIKVLNENLFRKFIQHATESTLKKFTNKHEMNILFVIPDHKKALGSKVGYLNQLYQSVLQQKEFPVRGEVMIGDIQQLEKEKQYLYYNGSPVHCLIEMYQGKITPVVAEVFKAGNVRLLNGPASNLVRNKLNLALLSDYRTLDNHPFNCEEKGIIDRYIPWTRKIAPIETLFNGQSLQMKDLILNNKDRLVIKPGDGYGGKGVYIGKHTSDSQWQEAFNIAMAEKNWLVQEYVESLNFLYQTGENGCEMHDMAWGFFLLGNDYAGGWTRVLPQKHQRGVINCHAGAKAGVIFEIET